MSIKEQKLQNNITKTTKQDTSENSFRSGVPFIPPGVPGAFKKYWPTPETERISEKRDHTVLKSNRIEENSHTGIAVTSDRTEAPVFSTSDEVNQILTIEDKVIANVPLIEENFHSGLAVISDRTEAPVFSTSDEVNQISQIEDKVVTNDTLNSSFNHNSSEQDSKKLFNFAPLQKATGDVQSNFNIQTENLKIPEGVQEEVIAFSNGDDIDPINDSHQYQQTKLLLENLQIATTTEVSEIKSTLEDIHLESEKTTEIVERVFDNNNKDLTLNKKHENCNCVITEGSMRCMRNIKTMDSVLYSCNSNQEHNLVGTKNQSNKVYSSNNKESTDKLVELHLVAPINSAPSETTDTFAEINSATPINSVSSEDTDMLLEINLFAPINSAVSEATDKPAEINSVTPINSDPSEATDMLAEINSAYCRSNKDVNRTDCSSVSVMNYNSLLFQGEITKWSQITRDLKEKTKAAEVNLKADKEPAAANVNVDIEASKVNQKPSSCKDKCKNHGSNDTTRDHTKETPIKEYSTEFSVEEPLMLSYEEGNNNQEILMYRTQSMQIVTQGISSVSQSEILKKLLKRSRLYMGDPIHVVFNPREVIEIMKGEEETNSGIIPIRPSRAKHDLLKDRSNDQMNLLQSFDPNENRVITVQQINQNNLDLERVDRSFNCHNQATRETRPDLAAYKYLTGNTPKPPGGNSYQNLFGFSGYEWNKKLNAHCKRKKSRTALKRVSVKQIVSSVFRKFFHFYSILGGHLKSGSVITKSNSNFWLRKSGVAPDESSLRIASDLFGAIAGTKVVLNIFDYTQFLIAFARKKRIIVVELVSQLMIYQLPGTTQRKESRTIRQREFLREPPLPLKRSQSLPNIRHPGSSGTTIF